MSNAPSKADDDGSDSEDEVMNICPCLPCCPAVRGSPPKRPEAPENKAKHWFIHCIKWIIFIPAMPFLVAFSWTIPDCSKEHNKKYYPATFFISVVWIAGLSLCMTTLVGRAGCIMGIDSFIMGISFVAIGTSVPDLLSSILVGREGYGDMAVSNAIGSNVFDINLGLGAPFIIRIAIDQGAPMALINGKEIVEYMDGTMNIVPHAKFGFILLAILIIALILMAAVKFKLNKWIGISFSILYFVFLGYAFFQYLWCYKERQFYC